MDLILGVAGSCVCQQQSQQSTSFNTTWVTTTSNETISLPLVEGYTYNATVDWGDENESSITAWDDADKTHEYANAGTYLVKITGALPAWSFNALGDCDKITKVHFGSGVSFQYLRRGFRSCTNLVEVTGQIADDGVTSMSRLFSECSGLTSIQSGLFDNNTHVVTFLNCFYNCNLPSIPSGLFDYNTLVTTFAGCFNGCNFEAITSGLFNNNTLVTTFKSCFKNCTTLKSKPVDLFNNNTLVTSFQNCFYDCTSLEGSSGELWLNPSGAGNYTLVAPNYDIGIPDGAVCYLGCTGLSDYATIPTYWK